MEERKALKNIHFVWAGGRGFMPPKSINVVKKWIEQNDECDIYLWLDPTTSGLTFAELKEEYESFFGPVLCKSLKIMDVRERYEAIDKMLDECSQYEIERLRPNYGCSSDLLRYNILYNYGGAYFDSDVEPAIPGVCCLPTAVKLQDFMDREDFKKGQQVLFIDHLTQLLNHKLVDPNQLDAPDLLKRPQSQLNDRIGNDSFICTRHNPLMKAIYERAVKNYKNRESLCEAFEAERSLEAGITMAYGNNYRKNIGVAMTGPGCVKMVLRSFPETNKEMNAVTLQVENTPVLVKSLRTRNYCVTDPLPNTLLWLKSRVHIQDSLEEAIKIVSETVRFELETLNILRLEDHIDDIDLALDHAVALDEIIEALLKAAKPIILGQLVRVKANLVVHCLFKYPQVTKFYDDPDFLIDDTTLIEDTLIDSPFMWQKIHVLQNVGSYFLVQDVVKSIKDGDFASDYDIGKIVEVVRCIKQGIHFISNFMKNESRCLAFENANRNIVESKPYWETCGDLLDAYEIIYTECSKSGKEEIRNTVGSLEEKLMEIKEIRDKIVVYCPVARSKLVRQ